MKIYGDMISGNCLKVKYTADLLGIPYEWVEADVLKGDSRTPDYLAKNPQGQVPMIELDDGRTLAQSNAIIRYLARGSRLLPDDAFAAAKVDEWLFWEQYSHEPYIAVCRFHHKYLGKPFNELDGWRVERGNAALDLMEDALEGKDWLTDSGFTLADIALLAYTQFAHEGGFSLEGRANVKAWVDRCHAEIGIS
ncbi:glutathione S-transferase family protein [Kordiimonas marina]|uniref:glutathione S-transferase family protein n=1 Tax=Kordiimonas marina TaxID=2872312 RepID=UPI001FF26C5F|nr:glutathione S-transferase family protein [Kordiimonas marina]MCJ9428622.1 glutathione S-transferase family protein [Kordiimonas marina]